MRHNANTEITPWPGAPHTLRHILRVPRLLGGLSIIKKEDVKIEKVYCDIVSTGISIKQ